MGGSQEITALSPRSHGHRRALVAARSIPGLDELEVAEAVRVDDQGAPTGAPAEEVVARVPNDKAQVVFPRKVDAFLHVILRLCRDDVHAVVARGADILGVCGWAAGFVGRERPHEPNWLLNSEKSRVSRYGYAFVSPRVEPTAIARL